MAVNTDWNKLIQEIYQDVKGYQDPSTVQLEALTQRWLDPNYQAYSPDKLQEWYEQGKSQLEGDIFKQWDEGYGRTMAAQGLTGSGVGNISYGKILGQKGGALADLWGDIQQFGEEATRADRAMGTQLVPLISQLRSIPIEQKMQLLNILGAERSSQRASDAQRKAGESAGLGSAIAGLVGLISKI